MNNYSNILFLVNFLLFAFFSPWSFFYKNDTSQFSGQEKPIILDVPFLSQTELKDLYPNELLGNGNALLWEEGCGIASLAMVFQYHGVDTDIYRLNRKLRGGNNETGFSGSLLAWDRPDTIVSLAGSGKIVSIERIFTYGKANQFVQKIDASLENNNPVIVFVNNEHYAVIVGKTSDGKYVINDPWMNQKKGEIGKNISFEDNYIKKPFDSVSQVIFISHVEIDPRTGYQVRGAISRFYYSIGGADGRMGSPISDEIQISDKKSWQEFEQGAIFNLEGGIYSLYGFLWIKYKNISGFENIGYPKWDLYPYSNGHDYFEQVDFENGSLIHKLGQGINSIQVLNKENAFKVEYYLNKMFSGEPIYTRFDTEINADWGNGIPGPWLTTTEYSIKWSGEIKPWFPLGWNYYFSVLTTGSLKIQIDDQEVFNSSAQGISKPFRHFLSSGSHNIQIEYIPDQTADLNIRWTAWPIKPVFADMPRVAPLYVLPTSYSSKSGLEDELSNTQSVGCLSAENKIAFVSNRDGNNEIYLMNADGSCQTRMTERPGDDISPKWALQGTNIVYLANQGSTNNLYKFVLSEIGTHDQSIIGQTYCEGLNCSDFYILSRTGDTLFYSGGGSDYGDPEIHKMDLKTKEDINLIEGQTAFLRPIFDLALSPDEQTLAFGIDTVGLGLINTYEISSSIQVPNLQEAVSSNAPSSSYPEYFYYEPIWSPDGEKLFYLEILPETPNAIFNINRYNVNTKNFKTIYSVQSEGSHIRADGAGGAWIPNSDTVVFSLLNKILLINTKTGEIEELTSGTNPSLSSDNRQLVFERDGDIYRINLDGSGEIRLTHNQGENIAPVWQPKSLREEFSGNGKIIIKDDCGICVNTDIFSVNADGSNLIQILGPDIVVGDFDISLPAGKVAFNAYEGTFGDCDITDSYCSDMSNTSEVYTINLDGTHLTRLTNNQVLDFSVSWSPDGTLIAFGSVGDNYVEIKIVDQNGAGEKTIWRSTNGQSFPFSLPPLFSPYGDEIIFSINNGVKYSLIKVDLQLGESSTLVESPSRIYDFSWSHDGEKILYGLASQDSGQLFVMNSDGTMNNPVSDSDRHLFPRGLWSPDSRKIAVLLLPPLGYTSESSIFLTNPEGKNREELVKSKYRIEDFHWLPDSMKLIYLTYSDQTTDFYAIDILSQVKQQVHSTEDYAYLFELSPDGKRVAYIITTNHGNSFTLNLVDITGGLEGEEIIIDSQLNPYLYMPEVVTWLPEN